MKINTFFIFLFSLNFVSSAQVMWQFKKDTVVTWGYFDGDEFNGDKVNTDYWDYTSGGSHTIFNNLEQQYYTNGYNHKVNNGTLKLIAKKEAITGKVIDWMGDNDSMISGKKFYTLNKRNFDYTSGMLNAKKTYKGGFFECRFKIPKVKGYWPAFWLHGGDPNEEIDMMECKSERPHQIHIETHCPNKCDVVNYYFQKRSWGGWAKTKIDFTNEYAIIACDWDENYVKYYLNGECIGVSNVKFAIEKYLTLNIAIPSNNGPFNPGPDKDSNEEAIFEVDYVRVWKKSTENKEKTTTIRNNELSTSIQTSNPILTKPKSKTKDKLVYGKKSDHANEGIFISYLNNKNFIQLTTLGILKNDKPTYKLLSSTNAEILTGVIENQVFNIDTSNLAKGEYRLSITYNDMLVQKSLTIN